MMVSNADISDSQQDQSLVQTGDSLAAANMKFASHLCYLIAKIYPGKFEDKISLLGETTKNEILKGDRVEFLKYATFEAMMMTEVWEYAVALQNQGEPDILSFQTFIPFKIMYATELYERQYNEKSLKYAEYLTNGVEKLSKQVGLSVLEPEVLGLAKLGYSLRRKVEEQISLGKTMLKAKENATNEKHSWLKKLDRMEKVVLGFEVEEIVESFENLQVKQISRQIVQDEVSTQNYVETSDQNYGQNYGQNKSQNHGQNHGQNKGQNYGQNYRQNSVENYQNTNQNNNVNQQNYYEESRTITKSRSNTDASANSVQFYQAPPNQENKIEQYNNAPVRPNNIPLTPVQEMKQPPLSSPMQTINMFKKPASPVNSYKNPEVGINQGLTNYKIVVGTLKF